MILLNFYDLHYAVLSFVEVTTLLFAVPGVQFLLSEKFCQDPLEWKAALQGL